MTSLLQEWALPLALLTITNISATWYNLINKHVPDPYLDEFFHVPQAQRYCKGDYTWDPKITTPPGLYLVSLLLERLIGCGTFALRALNAFAICAICLLTYSILRILRSRRLPEPALEDKRLPHQPNNAADQTLALDAHTALNIALFPPLFFFSGLYYTDVLSTLVVLLAYNVFLKGAATGFSVFHIFISIQIGVVALFFRQTNIFWVAVFPAGLTVVDALKRNSTQAGNLVEREIQDIIRKIWSEGVVYDRPVQDAGFLDYILFVTSIGISALRRPFLVLRAVLPYIFLLVLFTGFVVWNGGVVLGDKSNHVVTLHFPQMLYFWPYIVFFSAPLTITPLLRTLVQFFPDQLRVLCRNFFAAGTGLAPPRFLSTSLFAMLGLVAVHFNTIVHPFTLADNRHYVFYVFRLLLRHPTFKYLAVPFYYICAWATLQTLGHSQKNEAKTGREGKKATSNNAYVGSQPCQMSFIVVWLATTALSVVSAPLVEPRYFIIPWIIWRLHVPHFPGSSSSVRSIGHALYDMRLWLETIWALAINTVLAYNFLFRGFTWTSEPEKVQRFLF